MENLDGTVVITALPQMAQSFGIQAVDLNIGVSAYLLTLAVLIPASGWAAERWGARTVFAWAILVFTLASVLCGLSQGLDSFTAARILQGVGGAMMVPVGRLAVLRSTGKNELMRAIATITWPGLAAPVLGPPVGGFIATYWSWHWIFFLNVPLGLIGLVLALRMIPAGGGGRAKPFDLPGFLLTGTACLCLMYGIELAGRAQASFGLAGTCLAGSLVLGVLAVRHARRRSDALVDLWALRLRSFAVTIGGGSLFRMAISAVPFLLPLMFQLSFGLSAFEAGLLVLAVFAGAAGQRPDQCGGDRRLRAAHPRDPGPGDRRPSVRQRAGPIHAVHRPEHAGLRGCARASDERRQHPVQHRPADDAGPGHRARRRFAAVGAAVSRRRWRRGFAARLSDRISRRWPDGPPGNRRRAGPGLAGGR
jgi:MFS family permease